MVSSVAQAVNPVYHVHIVRDLGYSLDRYFFPHSLCRYVSNLLTFERTTRIAKSSLCCSAGQHGANASVPRGPTRFWHHCSALSSALHHCCTSFLFCSCCRCRFPPQRTEAAPSSKACPIHALVRAHSPTS